MTREVRELANGSKAEVTVMYLGLAAAYYYNAASGLAGVGRPDGESGWVWEPRNELARAVADAVAIYRNQKAAGYVLLPGWMGDR